MERFTFLEDQRRILEGLARLPLVVRLIESFPANLAHLHLSFPSFNILAIDDSLDYDFWQFVEILAAESLTKLGGRSLVALNEL